MSLAKKRYQKVLLFTATAIIVVLGSIQIYFSFFLEEQLKQRLVHRFHRATNNAYNLEIGDFDLEILGRQLILEDIQLAKKEHAGGTDFTAALEELNISGISFLNLLINQKLTLKQVTFSHPDISIIATESDKSNTETQWSHYHQHISNIILGILETVTIPDLRLRRIEFTYNQKGNPVHPLISLQKGNVHLRNVRIDSTSLHTNRFLPSDDIRANVQNFRYQSTDSLYDLSINNARLSSATQSLALDSVHLEPKFGKNEFAKHIGHETDRMELIVEDVDFRGLNMESLNGMEKVTAHTISVTDPSLDIYRDKRRPFPANTKPPLPQQMIRNVPFPFAVDSLMISGGTIRYEERHPQADHPGYITFSNLSASLTHFTNISERGWTPSIQTEATVMGGSTLKAKFSFPMDSNRQHISGQLGKTDLTSLNKALEPLAFVQINDGTLNSMRFSMDLGPDSASGNMTLLYNDLSISLLNKDSGDSKLGNQLKSFLANTFKIKSRNTPENPRIGTIKFKRDPQKSVFNYWWKSLLSGLKSSIGV